MRSPAYHKTEVAKEAKIPLHVIVFIPYLAQAGVRESGGRNVLNVVFECSA